MSANTQKPGKRRGDALVMLASVIIGWTVGRVAFFDGPFLVPELAAPAPSFNSPALPEREVDRVMASADDLEKGKMEGEGRRSPTPVSTGSSFRLFVQSSFADYRETGPRFNPTNRDRSLEQPAPPFRSAAPAADSLIVRRAEDASPTLLSLTGSPFRDSQQGAPSRWSGDAWLFLRDADDASLAAGAPSYGRSQLGLVARYDLSTDRTGRRPQAYARASSALEGAVDREIAIGASVRPVRDIPIRAAVEARIGESVGRREIRAATFVNTELPTFSLPADTRGEVYMQAGYVSGEFSTAFIDGQARVTKEVTGSDDVRVTAGAGAWGGAQRDAGRLDIGPTLGMNFRVGSVYGRASADYRFRVAGDAQPASGPALTLSAGF